MRIRTTGQARRLRRALWDFRAEEAKAEFSIASEKWMAAVFTWDANHQTGQKTDLSSIAVHAEAMDRALKEHRRCLAERDRT